MLDLILITSVPFSPAFVAKLHCRLKTSPPPSGNGAPTNPYKATVPTAQQMLEAFPFDTAPRYLLRDRDRIYGQEFRNQVAVMNIKEVLSAPRSPWQRAYVERVIGSIRRECLDHVIVLSEESLRRRLRSFFSYYHRSRLHLSLERDSPELRSVQSSGRIVAFPEVGGLHHRYDRVA